MAAEYQTVTVIPPATVAATLNAQAALGRTVSAALSATEFLLERLPAPVPMTVTRAEAVPPKGPKRDC